MQFGTYTIVHWNLALDSLKHNKSIKADALLLSGNPKTSLSEMTKKVTCSTLFIAGSNTDYNIKKWANAAQLLQIPVHIMKDDNVLVVNLR